jgi:hypothetical protein
MENTLCNTGLILLCLAFVGCDRSASQNSDRSYNRFPDQQRPAVARAVASAVAPKASGRTLIHKVKRVWLQNEIVVRQRFHLELIQLPTGDPWNLDEEGIHRFNGGGVGPKWELKTQQWNKQNGDGSFYWGSRDNNTLSNKFEYWAYKIDVYLENGTLLVSGVSEADIDQEYHDGDGLGTTPLKFTDLPYQNKLSKIVTRGGEAGNTNEEVENFFQELITEALKS